MDLQAGALWGQHTHSRGCSSRQDRGMLALSGCASRRRARPCLWPLSQPAELPKNTALPCLVSCGPALEGARTSKASGWKREGKVRLGLSLRMLQ